MFYNKTGDSMIESLGVFKDYNDGTLKSVYKKDNKIIEMSLLFNKKDKDVLCVPTHHFCNLGCLMCHLTNNSLNKKMLPINSEDFIECLFRSLTSDGKKVTSKKKLLISFMGVGEPLLNLSLLESVFKNEGLIKEKLGYEDVGYAIATMMPNENLKLLQDLVLKYEVPLKVHFSLHNPLDEKRSRLIPSSKVNINRALSLLKDYKESIQKNKNIMSKYLKLHTNNIPIEIHYTLIKGVNDGDLELNTLINLLSKYEIPIKFIKFNPKNDLKISLKEDEWVRNIEEKIPGLIIKRYAPPGREVGSSCGEFTKHYYHEEIETKEELEEFNMWYSRHLVKSGLKDEDSYPLN